MWTGTRRDFLSTTAAAMAGVGLRGASVLGQEAGERPARAEGVTVLNPQKRVPLSLIIDSATESYGLPGLGA